MPISSPYEAFKNAPSGYFSDAEIESIQTQNSGPLKILFSTMANQALLKRREA